MRESILIRQTIAGFVAGATLLVLDGALNGNPVARRLYAVYQPIARQSVNVLAGTAIDFAFGIGLVMLFRALRRSLPGRTRLTKALSFALIVWFLRVLMRVAGEWIITVVPAEVHAYTLVAGMFQMLVISGIIAWLLPEGDSIKTASPATKYD